MTEKTITIKKGKHSEKQLSWLFDKMTSKRLVAEVKFHENCLYDPLPTDYRPCRFSQPKNCRGDWNKLIGLMKPSIHPHKNSARIVWRVDQKIKKIQLGYYVYVDWIAPNSSAPWYCRGYNTAQKGLMTEFIEVDKWYWIQIEDFDYLYEFKTPQKVVGYETKNKDYAYINHRGESKTHNVKERKYKRPNLILPYFGGNCKAPHDITISFKFHQL